MKFGGLCEHIQFGTVTYRCSLMVYAFMYGHVGQFQGRNVVDVTRVWKVTDPHEAFHHILDAFTQHLFLIEQQRMAVDVKHEWVRSKKPEFPSVQRRWME